MIFHYAGKYNGDESKLPQREHPENYVPFREPQDAKQLALIANFGALGLMLLLAVPIFILGRKYMAEGYMAMPIGCLCSMLTLLPHELLHALCFKKDVYLYNDLRQGLMFVVGTEDMSKRQFIMMSLLPNIIFGVIPYVLFLIFPDLPGFGMFGMICIGMGFGDYLNVYNAIRQMPKDALTYICGMHSFWYMPK